MKKTIAIAALTAALVAIPTAVVTSLLVSPPMPTVIYAPGPPADVSPSPMANGGATADPLAVPPTEEPADGGLTDVARNAAETIN